eukprot:TRINITY_DN15019_c0_g1_i1.p1 TRINITY_DN15019_c0_g1~~TRINITY_DN15019_c0_g1_i1.p1  ORF type:complete len:354 (+),score=124.09 TRINITY_DN15019_c0_g1_i1:65-1126(+)
MKVLVGHGVHVPSLVVGIMSCAIAVRCYIHRRNKRPQRVMAFSPGNTQSIVVYASSSTKVDPVYVEAAKELGREIARRGWLQVNGGSESGLMGAATDGAVEAGGTVDIVILDKFVSFRHQKVRKVDVRHTMPQRKRGLYEAGNAFISLPGGLGTLEEAMEVLSWRQLGFHDKPSVLLNVNGFYDSLARFLEEMIDNGFVSRELRSTYIVTDSITEACDFVANYVPHRVDKSKIYEGVFTADTAKPGPTSDWQAAGKYAMSGPSLPTDTTGSYVVPSPSSTMTSTITEGQRVRLMEEVRVLPRDSIRSLPPGAEGVVRSVPGALEGTIASVEFQDGSVADVWPDSVCILSNDAE